MTEIDYSFTQQLNEISNLDEEKTKKRRKRCPFTKQEDKQLLKLVNQYGEQNQSMWHVIALNMKGRNARQCRERYQLYLNKDIKKKVKWTKEEDEVLLEKFEAFGPHWKLMEEFFEGRTSYCIKNRFISLKHKKESKEKKDKEATEIIFNENNQNDNNMLFSDKNCTNDEDDFQIDFEDINGLNFDGYESFFCFKN